MTICIQSNQPYRVCDGADSGGARCRGGVCACANEGLQERGVDGRHRSQGVVARRQQDLINDVDVRLAHLGAWKKTDSMHMHCSPTLPAKLASPVDYYHKQKAGSFWHEFWRLQHAAEHDSLANHPLNMLSTALSRSVHAPVHLRRTSANMHCSSCSRVKAILCCVHEESRVKHRTLIARRVRAWFPGWIVDTTSCVHARNTLSNFRVIHGSKLRSD